MIAKKSVLLLFFCVYASSSWGQGRKQLTITEIDVIRDQRREGGFSVGLPMKCSPEGNLYVQFYGSDVEPAIGRVSDDGKQLSWFSLRQVPEMRAAVLLDFAPGTNRDVFFLAAINERPRGPLHQFVVRVKSDGSSSVTNIGLKPGFILRQLAVLGSEHFVVSGFTGGQYENPTPFVAILDDSGELISMPVLTGDLQAKDEAQKAAKQGADSEVAPVQWIDLSSLQSAEDGSVYLSRSEPDGPVFLISPGGDVRRLKLIPPNANAVLKSVKIAAGRLAADYTVPDDNGKGRHPSLVVMDLASGKVQETVDYTNQQTGVGMVCYREGMFEFLAQGADGRLQIVKAVAR